MSNIEIALFATLGCLLLAILSVRSELILLRRQHRVVSKKAGLWVRGIRGLDAYDGEVNRGGKLIWKEPTDATKGPT